MSAVRCLLVARDVGKYLDCPSVDHALGWDSDASDLIAACFESGVKALLLHGETLSADFFQLRTGLAGAMLQKFVNYRIRVALLLPQGFVPEGRFAEMAAEAQRGQAFRIFDRHDEAEAWLLVSRPHLRQAATGGMG